MTRHPPRFETFSPPSHGQRSGRTVAFTLVELLVAVSVLALAVTLISLLASATVATTRLNHKRMDADSHARTTLDRLSLDLSRMPVRSDVDLSFVKQPGDDFMAFYSTTAALPGTDATAPYRQLSVVAYRVDDAFALERGAVQLDWDQMIFTPADADGAQWPQLTLPNSLPTAANDPAGDPAFFQTLSEQVFRFEIAFLLRADPNANPARPAPVIVAAPPTRPIDPLNPGDDYGDIEEIAAVIVAIAVLDPQSRVITNDGQLAAIQDALPDAVDGEDIVGQWTQVIEAPDFAATLGLPAEAASAIRVYQRYYYLP